uniref:Uncharacterized protein n=1 Tax=Octopus bimaculoides TaxID=37653 RepID=A0A0L8GAH2_OCTBM
MYVCAWCRTISKIFTGHVHDSCTLQFLFHVFLGIFSPSISQHLLTMAKFL